MKLKTVYVCEKCKHSVPKWVGKCPNCNEWNTFIEDVINIGKPEEKIIEKRAKQSIKLSSRKRENITDKTNIAEVDLVLGGGFMRGSINLLGGEPGIGKSTLTLQITNSINLKNIIYISGEESSHQISSRADRLNLKMENVSLVESSNIEETIATIDKSKPQFVIIDSIQVMSSDYCSGNSGSISQIRYCTEKLMHFAKANNITMLVIGHVNKDGDLAGPKVLEHLVDSVFMLEGERFKELRSLRSIKNRFGSTNEVGLFIMQENGLNEVVNPSEYILKERAENSIGSCLSVVIEGSRPLIIEVQALTNVTAFGYPKRTVTGYDTNRLQMITAVIQKYTKINLLNQDIYINIVGGLKINDPALDLAVALAIISSYKKIPLNNNLVAIGEIGLCSEVRNVKLKEKRTKECIKLGLNPFKNKKKLNYIVEQLF